MTVFSRFLADESGATSIEYSIMASCIGLAIIAVVNGVGGKVLAQYTSVSTAFN